MAIPLKRTANSPPSKDGKKHKEEDCIVCDSPATENVMECVWCEARLHAKCAKLSDEQCILIGNASRNIVFFCTSCLEILPEAFKSYNIYSLVDSRVSNVEKSINDVHSSIFQGLKAELTNLQSVTSNLATKIKDLYTQNNTLQEQLQTASLNLTKSPQQSIVNAPSQSVTNTYDVIEEMRDRERRRRNVVVYNFPEKSDRNADMEAFKALSNTVFNLDLSVVKAVRLGPKVDNKTRPLLLILEDFDDKNYLISHSHFLKKHKDFDKVFIAPDRSKLERIKHKKAVDELKQRRAKGETALVIRNGVVVKRQLHQTASTTPEASDQSS